jgi:hypothetical protein
MRYAFRDAFIISPPLALMPVVFLPSDTFKWWIHRAVDEHEHQDEAHERKHEHVQNLFASEYVWAPVAPTSLTGYDVRTYFGFYSKLRLVFSLLTRWAKKLVDVVTVVVEPSGSAALFAGNRDIRLPLNLPELVLYAEKMPVSWLFTAKGGEYAGKVPSFCL